MYSGRSTWQWAGSLGRFAGLIHGSQALNTFGGASKWLVYGRGLALGTLEVAKRHAFLLSNTGLSMLGQLLMSLLSFLLGPPNSGITLVHCLLYNSAF